MQLSLGVCVLVSLVRPGTRAADYPPPREPFTLSWTGEPLVWPSAEVRAMYRAAGQLSPASLLATRAAICRDDVFLAFPRYLPGVPATLVKTPLLSANCEAVFTPFPSWKAQSELHNVVDLHLDRKDVLWVLDSGVVSVLESPAVQGPPRVLGYDPVTGKLLHRVDLSSLTTLHSRLQYLAVEVDPLGHRYLYVSDAGTRCVLVYDLAQDRGFRAQLPDGLVSGCVSEVPDVLYLGFTRPSTGGSRLYLTTLCGGRVYSVLTKDLRDAKEGSVERVEGEKPERMVLIGSDHDRKLYFRVEGEGDVFEWDVQEPLGQETLRRIHQGDGRLLATQAVLDPIRGKVRILQSNFLDFFRGTVGVGAVHVLRAVS